MESNLNYESISDVASTFMSSHRSGRGNLFKKTAQKNRIFENGDIVFEKEEGKAGCHYIRLPLADIDPEVKSSNHYVTLPESTYLKRPLKQALVLTFVDNIDDLAKP
jgi:hypothetical protein